jgi:hypothetical protein
MRLFLATTLTLLFLAPGYAFAGCLHANEKTTIIEGVLSERTFSDASNQAEQAFILTPLVPTCLEGDDNVDKNEKIGEIQIMSSNDMIAPKIKNFVGQDVFVQGSPFGAHTANDHAPIVMDITGIDVN